LLPPRIKREKKKVSGGGGDWRWSKLRQQYETDRATGDSGPEDVYLLVNRIRGRDFRIGFVTELLFAVFSRCGTSEKADTIDSVIIIIIIIIIASGLLEEPKRLRWPNNGASII